MEESRKENKMGTMSVNRLLVTMSVPMIISMLVQALYNIVDSVFVSWICEDALTAVSMAFPVQNLMIALASGTGVGMNAILSRALGAKDATKASDAARHGVFLALCSYLVFLVFGLFGVHFFFETQTDSAAIIGYGDTYLKIVCIVSFGLYFQMTFERILQGTGRTIYTMITQATGALINLVLDPILIFGLFGMPKMGIAGAALATVFGQCVAGIMAVVFNIKINREISLNFKGFRPKLYMIRNIYAVGLPSILMVSISSIMTYGMNRILTSFTSTATAVFGVYFKLQSFIFMPVFGLNNGMVPIVAYNYGAEQPDRIMKTVRLSILYAVCMMLIGVVLFETIPATLLGFFHASDAMLEIGVPALRIIALHFLLAGFCIISSSFFQALGHGLLSLIVSFGRQLVVLLPAAFLLSLTGKVAMVWWAFPIAECSSVLLCVIGHRYIHKRVIQPLGKDTVTG